MNILLLTHDFGFPEGYAATMRARLMARALVGAGASVEVFCLRYSEIPPDTLNTEASGVREGVRFRYTNGSTTRAASFAGRRTADVKSVASAMRSILAMRRAGRLDAVYLWSTAMTWNPMSQLFVSFLGAARIPVVLELNERPWSQGPAPRLVERRLSPLRGIGGAIVISDYLEEWTAAEARRLGRDVRVIRVPILVDTHETPRVPDLPARRRPYVLFACPPGRTELFSFVTEAMRPVWGQGLACDLVITGGAGPGEASTRLGDGGDGGSSGDGGSGSVDRQGTVPRDTLLGLYRQASALLLPLTDELNSSARFPTKLGEYLASGAPVVASARGELLRYLEDGNNAFLVSGDGPQAFGLRIVDVLKDPASAAEVGERGREVAIREFDYHRFGGVLYDWFMEMRL